MLSNFLINSIFLVLFTVAVIPVAGQRQISKDNHSIQTNGEYGSLASAIKSAIAEEEIKPENIFQVPTAVSNILPYALTSKLTTEDDRSSNGSTLAVDIDGDTAVLGAPYADLGRNQDQGAVYVFRRRGLTWSLEQKLFSSDGSHLGYFGSKVVIEGNTLLVRSSGHDFSGAPQPYKEYVYVFTRNGTTWSEQQKLFASDGVKNDAFGAALAIDGETILIGAYNDAYGASYLQGSVYVFERTGGGSLIWTERGKLTAKDAAPGDYFGYSIAASEGTLVVGAPEADRGDGGGHGAAYIFRRDNANPAGWSESQRLNATDAFIDGGEAFGSSVAISSDTIAIGAPEEESRRGAVYIFQRAGAVWERQQKLVASNAAQGVHFGWSVAVEGGRMAVGAPFGGLEDKEPGAVYVFRRTGNVWSEEVIINFPETGFRVGFGGEVAISDGTIITNAHGADAGKGAAYIYNDTTLAPDLRPESDTGASSSDNITSARSLSFNITGAGSAIRVELLRAPSGGGDAVVVASGVPSLGTIVLTDDSRPGDGTYRYSIRQIFGNSTSVLGAPTFVTVDTTAPSGITINQAAGQPDPVNFQPIEFTTIFSEPVSGFTAADVSLAGSTANVSAATITVTGSGSIYKVLVSGVTGDGSIQATVLANAVSDLAGNLAAVGSSSTDNTVYLDMTPPTVTINQAADQSDPTRTLPVKFTVVFSEPVTGFDRFDVSLAGSTGNLSNASISVEGSGTTYIVSISNLQFAGQTIQVNVFSGRVQDSAGNSNIASTTSDNKVRLLSTFADYDADGRADVSVFRPDNGVWYLRNSTGGFTSTQFGVATDRLAPADFDGDGRTDIAVFRNGTWYLRRNMAGFIGIAFGEASDIPQPADFTGDGRAELAVFRPSNGGWYIYNLVNNQVTSVQFGQSGDVPVAADYDGDGRTDPAVYRPSAGTWFVQRSRDGFYGFAFGTSTDKPVPADFDGDGKTDVAVFRPENGVWYIQRSRDGFTGFQFGFGTDKPVPADYDGDGKADIAVFRDGTWYLQRSRDGFFGINFGAATDKPVPNAFVP